MQTVDPQVLWGQALLPAARSSEPDLGTPTPQKGEGSVRGVFKLL